MDNTSLRGRFSLSSTNLTTPIAESTCLNGSSSQAKFNWGEGTISPRCRNNSLISTKNTSVSKNLNGTPSKVSMSPASRIDPRTYVDIHSNGLASRIVKYHDNSTRINRSLSMGNLYNKPGQFPVVHLKKNDMQYKAKKCRNLSMTRIAAPETSVFHGNTLSSILRSGSIVGMQKTDEEISRENRPILHPPPTENELAPTRSVLEVLKEISRKRINSDELDGTDLIKKHCKEPEYDGVSYNGQRAQSKRQREMSSTTASNTQISPEQHAVKKRMCNYNNDIMSSLSSSMLSINKKKMLEMQSQKRNASELISTTATSADIEYSSKRNEKQQRYLGNFDLDHLSQANKSYTPITPLASTPQQNTGSADALEISSLAKVTRRSSEPFVGSIKPKLTLFNKDYDQAPTKVTNDIPEGTEDGDLCGIQFVKPKKSSSLSSDGTLLLEKTKQSKLALMLKGLKGELDEEDEVDTKVQAPPKPVEVKASVSITAASTAASTQAGISFGTAAATTTTTATKITPTIDVAAKPVAAAGISSTTATVVKNVLQFNAPTTTAAVSSIASGAFQISASTVVSNTASTTTVVSAAPVSTTPVSSSTTSIPTLGGFSFGLNKPLSLPAVTTTTPATSLPTLVQTTTTTASLSSAPVQTGKIEGIKSFGGFGLSTTQAPKSTSTATPPTFSFGAPSTLSLTQPTKQTSTFGSAPTASTKTSVQPPPAFGQPNSGAQSSFTFGALAANNSTSTVSTTSSSLMTSAPGAVQFGSPKPTFGAAVPQPAAAPNAGLSGSAFNPTSNTNPQATTMTGGFTFSGPSTTSSMETPKTMFGSMVPSTTAPPNANATFSFSANKQPAATPTNPTGAFTFGSPAVPPVTSVATTAQPPMFGNITPIKPANTFSFGAAPAPVVAAPAKTSFSFSGTTDKAVVPPNAGGSIVGGFAFNAPTNPSEPNKNIFAAPTAVTSAPAKSVFSFGSSSSNPSTAPPPMFGASTTKPTNLFGAPAATTAQSSPFGFGSSSAAPSTTSAVSSSNPFGATTAASNLGPASSSSTASIFGQQSAAVAPLQQSSTFAFGASSTNATTEPNKPAAGGFVFGSSSSIGSNASKPATDINKTFVFRDGSTTLTPAPAPTQSLFGGGGTTNNITAGAPENKLFSFGGASAGAAPSNNTFGGGRQTPSQPSVFSFGGAAAPATSAPAQNGNLFAPQPQSTGTAPIYPTSERPIRKAMRRLHKT